MIIDFCLSHFKEFDAKFGNADHKMNNGRKNHQNKSSKTSKQPVVNAENACP